MPRISALPSLTTADNSDELPIVDVSASVTKKITRGDLLKAPLPTNSVTTAAITNASVTEPKIDFSSFGNRTQSFTGTGATTVSLTSLPTGTYLVLASCRGAGVVANTDSNLAIVLGGVIQNRAYSNITTTGNQINYFCQAVLNLTSSSTLTITKTSIPTVADGIVTLVRIG